MTSQLNHSTHAPVARRLWKPVALASAGSAASAIWFDEIISFAQEVAAVFILTLMAGVIYLLDILMFRSRMPGPKDLENPNASGAKKE